MKNRYLPLLASLLIAIAASLTITSCYDDDWSPGPPSSWGSTFYDSALTGNWELVQVNGSAVRGDEANYLSFNGSGRGYYYYYHNGALYRERTAYWCEQVPYVSSGSSAYEINIQYESGNAATMSYWFTDRGDTLWMQWRTNGGIVSYVYRYVGSIPY